ncbi:MAG TPA: hypothetical protein VF980_15645, partial [Thermoanaerobaculia bacterium]
GSTQASRRIGFGGVQNLPVDVLPVETGNHRQPRIAIGEFEISVAPGSAAPDVTRDADRIRVPERQSESVKLLIADVPRDISDINLHRESAFLLHYRATIHSVTAANAINSATAIDSWIPENISRTNC